MIDFAVKYFALGLSPAGCAERGQGEPGKKSTAD
jgi:hypothetical protein